MLPQTLQELGAGVQDAGPPSPRRGDGVGGLSSEGGGEARTGMPGLAELQGTSARGSSRPVPAHRGKDCPRSPSVSATERPGVDDSLN